MTQDVTQSMKDRTNQLANALRKTVGDQLREPFKTNTLTVTDGFTITMAALSLELVELGRTGGLEDDEIIEAIRRCMVDIPKVADDEG